MQDPRWPALESAFEDYLKENFLDGSAKRETEFDTLWYVSHNDGGKFHLKQFFSNLEDMATNLE